MIAATARRYGPPEVMRLETLPDPVPGTGELLIRVQAFGVTRGDARIRGLDAPRGMGLALRLAFGLTRPRQPVLGREFAGIVAALGPGVTGWTPGEAVMGITPGMRMGAGAEFLTLPTTGLLVRRPETLTAPEAAGFLFGALTAADFLIDQARLQPGERLLVNGATGAVGLAALRIARHLGARITAAASPANHALAVEHGAEGTHDYHLPPPSGPFDVILDVAGTLPWPRARPLLAPKGRLCLVTADLAGLIGATLRPTRGTHRLCAAMIRETPEAVARALALHTQGALVPRTTALPLDQIVEAHRLAGSGHKQGAVTVTF